MGIRRVLRPPERTLYSREEIKNLITPEYIRGLFEGEATFTNDRHPSGKRIPSVALRLHHRDRELIEGIRDYLGIPNRVYEYTHNGRHYAMLIIRNIATLKNVIVPLFKNQLLGNKGVQFEEWLKMFPYLNSLHHRDLPRKGQKI